MPRIPDNHQKLERITEQILPQSIYKKTPKKTKPQTAQQLDFRLLASRTKKRINIYYFRLTSCGNLL